MEKVDIVDGNDRIIGCCTKVEAHEKGLLHRTVIGLVIGSDGKWTLIKQAADRQDAFRFAAPLVATLNLGRPRMKQ